MTNEIDLRLGEYQLVLADVGQVDCVITDPPYGATTHDGHNAGVDHALTGNSGATRSRSANTRRRKIDYGYWTSEDVDEFMDFWHPRTRGWICAMSCSDLFNDWKRAAERVGRVSFAPIACVIRGMSVRLGGDGPSSWVVYLNVSRPRGKEWVGGNSKVGAYVVTRGAERYSSAGHNVPRIGGKPPRLMNAIVRDYSKRGELVCDPCAGHATTAIAAAANDRRFVGAEIDTTAWNIALDRLALPSQGELFG